MINLLKKKKINVCIQGLGYVGSSMAVALGTARDKNNLPIFNIIGVEKDSPDSRGIINDINKGKFPFNTNDNFLIKKFKETFKKGNFKATLSHSAYSKADVILVSVNCDVKKKGKQLTVDLYSFKRCIEEFAKKIKENTLIIIESTVPPGTCEKIVLPTIKKIFLRRKLNTNKFFLAHSYERVMPGKDYLNSIINNWRVFSGVNKKSAELCEIFLNKFINTKKYPLTRLDNTKSSELSKLMENSFRAVNIAFVEEWSRFAEKIGINIFKVIAAIKKRPTHSNIKSPGFGVGGYCLTKDPLMADLSANTIWKIKNNFIFSKKAVAINNTMPLVSVKKILEFFNYKINGKKFLLLGASYKEEVDDTRNSPSKIFYSKLLSLGAKVDVHDPLVEFWKEVNIVPKKKMPSLKKYNCVVFAVKHKDYNKINFSKWSPKKKNFLFFDANNVLSNHQIKIINKSKFNIASIGIGK